MCWRNAKLFICGLYIGIYSRKTSWSEETSRGSNFLDFFPFFENFKPPFFIFEIESKASQIRPFKQPQFVGMVIDMEKRELSFVLEDSEKPILCYSGIPSKVHIFACVAFSIQLTLTKHICGEQSIQNYLKDWNTKRKHEIETPNSK